MRFCKNILVIVTFLFIFCLGFILGRLQCTSPHQINEVYVYDSEQKVEDYYKMMEKSGFDALRLPPETPVVGPRVRSIITNVRRERPLVVVGPFVVFVNNDNGDYSVRENPLLNALVTKQDREQSTLFQFESPIEKEWNISRFTLGISYSQCGVYERGILGIHKKDGMPSRTYFDTEGLGFFDRMDVYENGVQVTYRLTDTSWEQVAEQPYAEYLKVYENGLIESASLFGERDMTECGTSSETYNVKVEQIDTN